GRSSRSVANAAAAAQTAAAPAKYPSPIPSATAGQPSIILPVTATPRYDASAPSTGAAGIANATIRPTVLASPEGMPAELNNCGADHAKTSAGATRPSATAARPDAIGQ